jgi:hypothetical protein
MKTGTSQIWELIYGGEPTKSQIRKTMGIYYAMIVVFSLALYIANEIWHFNNEMTWWLSIIGGFIITTGFYGYLFLYKRFLLSNHKILFIIVFISIVLFKLLPYILGWKKF